ncbi:MAG: glycosyltransferase family 2 protein, partial [Paludibacteraceae bacterium]|nr:glycosyltransferase family 2 protein [Paludibacteraceae bacterium]
PASVVYHVGGGALPYNNPRKTYLNFRNNLWMLQKNLPKKRLWWVMTVRFFLDYTAALMFLLKGQPANPKAVVQARATAYPQAQEP